MFTGFDMEAFAERTRIELLATGEHARSRTVETRDGPYIANAIIAHGQRSRAAAPPGSLPAHLILQQRHLEHRHR